MRIRPPGRCIKILQTLGRCKTKQEPKCLQDCVVSHKICGILCLTYTYIMLYFSIRQGETKRMSGNTKQSLNEMQLNLTGKLFFAALGASLVGRPAKTKIRGTKEQIGAVTEALTASRNFQNELNNPEASIDSVMGKLNLKHMAVVEFERVFGISWPL